MVRFQINDRVIEAPEGITVLRAAEVAGISIPTLCDHPDLSIFGGCRLCIVEVKGYRQPVTACTLPVSEGLVIQTETPAIFQSRQALLKMLLYSYTDPEYDPASQPQTPFIALAQKYGVDIPSVIGKKPRYAVDSDPGPFLHVDLNKCILCTRCIRACNEVQGRMVWRTAGRGAETRLTAGIDSTLAQARCESCGACVAYCPTGALDNKMSLTTPVPDRLVTTTCTYCGVGCNLDLNVRDDDTGGTITRVTSNPNAPVNGMHLCVKGRYGYDFIHHPDRITQPLVRRYLLNDLLKPVKGETSAEQRLGSEWVEVDWDTALDVVALKLRQTRDRHGPDSVGVLTSAKCTNEENYLMNKFARQVIGTNSIDHCARL